MELSLREWSLREQSFRQGGVFTAADARTAGYSPAQARTLIANGDWVRMRRNVFVERPVMAACSHSPQARHALRTAAALVLTAGSRFAAGASAGCVWDLETLGDPPEKVCLGTALADDGSRPASHGFRRGAARTLISQVPVDQRVSVFGLACTSAARTAVDLARSSPFAAGVVALDSVARQYGTTEAELREVAALQAGWPYARRTLGALDCMDERTESVLETLGRLSLRYTSLPRPLCQAWLGENCAEVRVDLFIPAARLVGEGDGRLKYTEPKALWKEKKRQERLENLGFEVVRFDWDEAFRGPRRLAQRFEAAAARARSGPGRVFPDPAWWQMTRRAVRDPSGHTIPWWLRRAAA